MKFKAPEAPDWLDAEGRANLLRLARLLRDHDSEQAAKKNGAVESEPCEPQQLTV